MGFLRDKSKSNQSSQQQSTQSSQSQSSSENVAYPWLQTQLGSTVSNGTSANNTLSNMLGLNGKFDQNGGFQNFLDNSGYSFINDQGNRAVTGSKAASGMLGSGSYGTALQARGQNTAKSYLNDYLAQLMGQSGQGVSAANVVGGAGQKSQSTGTSAGQSTGQSTGTSTETQGLGSLIGSLASTGAKAGLFSDRRLKKNIVEVGRLQNGLTVYGWTYLDGTKSIGVMADEVAKVRPDALGPVVDGFATVNYAQLRKAA